MAQIPVVEFPPFHVDMANEQLWRGPEQIHLRPKTFAALRYLVEHAEQLVTKETLFTLLWPGTYVSDSVLMVCIRELRKALGDEARSPRFIETVHGRGYRFVATVTTAPHAVQGSTFKVPCLETQSSPLSPQTSAIVGRDAELVQLRYWFNKALNGERQTVFVTGEPGIGKTTIVEAFLRQLVTEENVWIGRGQCIEHYGTGEAYMPVLEAVGRLCREPAAEQRIAVLRQYAPAWLAQLPGLVPVAEREQLEREEVGATPVRMLRELGDALDNIAAERPLVLWLEDLQWSDASTIELLALLARRTDPARVLVIGTYRPIDLVTAAHPLKPLTHELYAQQLATELAVPHFSDSAVSDYLTQRFPQSLFPTRLASVLAQRTGGNPLFLCTLVQELVQRNAIEQAADGTWLLHEALTELEAWTPESVRHVLARQQERLGGDDQRVLQAASVAGAEFSAATVAAALEIDVLQVEDTCGRLVEQQQCLHRAGFSAWPDGTRASQYGFQHALYQEWWHERVSVSHQQQWHLRMGRRKEQAYGERSHEIAVELAVHFEQGGDYQRTVHYLHQAGENAVRRSAYREALILLSKGLELLKTLPETPECTERELLLQTTLAVALTATKGGAAPEVGATYMRARALCLQLGETPHLFPVLLGLWRFYNGSAEFQTARTLAEQLLHLTQRAQDRPFLVAAHQALGTTLFLLGEFVPAREHLEQGITLYDPQQHHHPRAFLSGHIPGVVCRCYASVALWTLGYPDQALKHSQEAIALAQELSHPFSLVSALFWAAVVRGLRRERQAGQELGETLQRLAHQQGFAEFSATGTISRSLALTKPEQREERIALLHQGMSAFRATGAGYGRSMLLLGLAEAYRNTGQREAGLQMLTESLGAMEKTGERCYEAELYRIKGELLLLQENNKPKANDKRQKANRETSPPPLTPSAQEAEACFLKAIDIARKQQAKSWELRATIRLARLWQQGGKAKEAHQVLSEVYHWFTEGFDTKDLQEAKALLETLSI